MLHKFKTTRKLTGKGEKAISKTLILETIYDESFIGIAKYQLRHIVLCNVPNRTYLQSHSVDIKIAGAITLCAALEC